MTTPEASHSLAEGVSLSAMLKDAIVDTEGKKLGRLRDVVVKLRPGQYPLFAGVIISVGRARCFVPANNVTSMDAKSIQVRTGLVNLLPPAPRNGEVLLKQDILGHRLIDVPRSALVRAYDVRFAPTTEGWVATGLDVHKHRWFQLGTHAHHPARDWHSFLLLIGEHKPGSGSFFARLRGLKPAQIADMIEGASSREREILLAEVHADPELEADVFEELDDDRKTQLLKSRSDADIAEVVSRMRADDAADTIMDLPQDRRRAVLDSLPQDQNRKIIALLGYHEATAGGLMGTDYLAVSEEQTVAHAIDKLRAATTHQPEALTTIHALRADGTLAGTLSLVRALQIGQESALKEVIDARPVVASPEDDIIAITTRMADFNLLSLPVLDQEGRMLGIVTVDDALEAAIQREWFQRKSGGQ